MKKEKFCYIILSILVLVLILLGSHGNLFGSNVDWLNQHTVFPEYFRHLFYETGSFFPNFAFGIGGGQNIFHFSYYGLFHPLMYFSYLFPHLEMVTFIQIMMIGITISSVLLFYSFLKRRGVSIQGAFLTSCFFAMATPLIYQAHRHFMFVSYMPFLILGLIGIDRYLEKKGSSFLILSIFLMILTSYYYSIGGLLVLVVYYLYRYFQRQHVTFKTFLCDSLRISIPFLLGIFLASFLLFPTLYVVLHGRGGTSSSISLLDLFLPHFDLKTFLYDGYGLGFTVLSLLALGYGMTLNEKDKRFLSIVVSLLLVCPFVIYLLNGGLYLRGKALIPFLPLVGLILSFFIEDVLKNRVKSLRLLFGSVFVFAVLCQLKTPHGNYFLLFVLDFLLTLAGYWFFFKKNHVLSFFALCFVFAFGSCLTSNLLENYVSYDRYQKVFPVDQEQLVSDIKEKDEGIYRMAMLNYALPTINKVYGEGYYHASVYSSVQNAYYQDFFRKELGNAIANRNNLMVTAHPNVLLNTFMGVKYVFTSNQKAVPLGYYPIFEGNAYRNDHVFPLMYHDSKLLSSQVFDSFSYPERVSALMENTVVDGKGSSFSSSIQEAFLSFKSDTEPSFNVERDGQMMRLEVHKKETVFLHTDADLTGKILLLDFQIQNRQDCTIGDRAITINGMTNKLTCTDWIYANDNYHFQYVLSGDGLSSLEVIIDPGVYEIEDIHTYLYDYEIVTKRASSLTPFVFDLERTKGDAIEGDIDVVEDGYFVSSIPYDEGFLVLVDGKETAYEKVNTAFLGFPLDTGKHHIVIRYEAPWAKEGRMGSFVSGFILLVMGVATKICGKRKKRRGDLNGV